MKFIFVLILFFNLNLSGQEWANFINNNDYFKTYYTKIQNEGRNFQKPTDFLNFSSQGSIAIKDNYRNQWTESLWTFGDLSISFSNAKMTKWVASNYLTIGHQGFTVGNAITNFAYSKDKFGLNAVQTNMSGDPIGRFIVASVEGVENYEFIGWGVELQNRTYNQGNFWALFAFGTRTPSNELLNEINQSNSILSFEGKFLIADHKTGKIDPNGIITLFFDIKNHFFFGQMQTTENQIFQVRGILHKFDRKMEAEIYNDAEGKKLGKLEINPFGNLANEIGGTFILNLARAGSTGVVALKRSN